MGSWLGAWFAQQYGWRIGFYFFGTAGMILAVVLYFLLREPVRGASEEISASSAATTPMPYRQALGAIFKTPTVLLLMLAFVGANFVATIFLTWTPTFLYEKFHFKLAAAGLSGAIFIQLASVSSVSLSGWLADWLTVRLPGGRMLVQAAGLLLGASFVALVGSAETRPTLIVAMTMFGFCKGIYDANIFASIYDVVPPAARATAAGLMNTVGWGGGALGPIFVGWMAEHGKHASKMANMSHAISLGGLVYLVSAALLVVAFLTCARRNVAKQS